MDAFVERKKKKRFRIQGHNIKLKLIPEVFSPSRQGSQLARFVDANPGERVLDMGTGSGLLGIVAGLQGGVVDVSDPSMDAVSLATENAKRNGVVVGGYLGEYFDSTPQIFDYIIANLPQEILSTRYAREIGELTSTIDGGTLGNEHLLTFLEQAHTHMHDSSRALIAVHSFSDYFSTLKKMHQLYKPHLKSIFESPAKDYVQRDIDEFQPLIEQGIIGTYKKDGLWQSVLMVYELQKRSEEKTRSP